MSRRCRFAESWDSSRLTLQEHQCRLHIGSFYLLGSTESAHLGREGPADPAVDSVWHSTYEQTQAELVKHFIRHGNYMTHVTILTHPVYLTEPLVKTQNFEMPTRDPGNWLWPCEYVEEITSRLKGEVPHAGENPFLKVGNEKELYFNGEGIQMMHIPAAHTDGDTLVYFRRCGVISAGDLFLTTSYPVVDLERGGSIQGVIAGLNRILDLAIPAHHE
jgi:hypothetical protein